MLRAERQAATKANGECRRQVIQHGTAADRRRNNKGAFESLNGRANRKKHDAAQWLTRVVYVHVPSLRNRDRKGDSAWKLPLRQLNSLAPVSPEQKGDDVFYE